MKLKADLGNFVSVKTCHGFFITVKICHGLNHRTLGMEAARWVGGEVAPESYTWSHIFFIFLIVCGWVKLKANLGNFIPDLQNTLGGGGEGVAEFSLTPILEF